MKKACRAGGLIVINKQTRSAGSATRASNESVLPVLQHRTPAGAQGPGASARSGSVSTNLEAIGRFRESMQASGEFETRRSAQAVDWMWDTIERRARALRFQCAVRRELPALVAAVRQGSWRDRRRPAPAGAGRN